MNNYPPELAHVLESIWSSLQQSLFLRMHRNQLPPLPDPAGLRSLLSVAFQASLLSEEQRRVCFSIILASPAQVQDHDPETHIVSFPEPLPLRPAQIIGLAPAIHPSGSMIGVTVNKSSSLEAWGIIHSGSAWWNRMHGRSTSADVIATEPPWYLRVSSFHPGQIILSVGAYDCLVLEGGEIYQPGGPIVAEASSPIADFFIEGRISLVEAVSAKLGHYPKYDMPIRDSYDNALIRLLAQVQQRGHGGAFVFFKEPVMASNLERLLKPKFSVNIAGPWERLVEACAIGANYKDPEGNDIYTTYVLNRLQDAIAFVSGLTAVDGAVIISNQFRVKGFGVEILTGEPGKSEVRLRKWSRPRSEEIVPVHRFGTRHRSAFRLCEVSSDCLVFVFSQDGPVRAVWNDGEGVIVWDRADPGLNGGPSSVVPIEGMNSA